MKIKVTEIKEFFRRSGSIKSSSLLPILNYIKLESKDGETTISKTNEKSYCIHQIECREDGTVLLDEKKLTALINQAKDEEISIKQDDKNVYLRCGAIDINFPKADDKLYPSFPSYGGNKEVFVLGKSVLESIGIAKNFVHNLPGSVQNQYSYLHIHNKAVYSTNGVVAYHKPFEEDLPSLVLDDEATNTIIRHESLQYFRAGNYDFFDTGKTIYGFIKPEYPNVDLTVLINSLKKDQWFTITKDDIVSFCELVNNSTSEKTPVSKLENGQPNTLILSCNEDGGNIKIPVTIESNFHPDPFGFNTKLIQPFLKSLPYQKLKFSPGNMRYTIWTEEDHSFTGVIAQHQL